MYEMADGATYSLAGHNGLLESKHFLYWKIGGTTYVAPSPKD